jgi:hypothetical protein
MTALSIGPAIVILLIFIIILLEPLVSLHRPNWPKPFVHEHPQHHSEEHTGTGPRSLKWTVALFLLALTGCRAQITMSMRSFSLPSVMSIVSWVS